MTPSKCVSEGCSGSTAAELHSKFSALACEWSSIKSGSSLSSVSPSSAAWASARVCAFESMHQSNVGINVVNAQKIKSLGVTKRPTNLSTSEVIQLGKLCVSITNKQRRLDQLKVRAAELFQQAQCALDRFETNQRRTESTLALTQSTLVLLASEMAQTPEEPLLVGGLDERALLEAEMALIDDEEMLVDDYVQLPRDSSQCSASALDQVEALIDAHESAMTQVQRLTTELANLRKDAAHIKQTANIPAKNVSAGNPGKKHLGWSVGSEAGSSVSSLTVSTRSIDQRVAKTKPESIRSAKYEERLARQARIEQKKAELLAAKRKLARS